MAEPTKSIYDFELENRKGEKIPLKNYEGKVLLLWRFHVAKNSNVADYSKATAFEALIGYLYLTKQDERLEEILLLCLD